MKKKIFLHIGIPKTANTFLQRLVFRHIKDIHFIGPQMPELYDTPIDYINRLNQLTLKKPPLTEQEISKIKDEILSYIDSIDNEIVFIGQEQIAGQIVHFKNSPDNTAFLKNIFGEAKVIITFRNQYEWGDSVYNHLMTKDNKYIINEEFLAFRHGHSINEFFKFNNGKFHKDSYIYKLDWFNNITQNYIDAFGKDNVLVLPYELLKEDLNEFLRRFYDFTGFEPYYPENIENLNPRTNDKILKFSPILSRYSAFTQNLSESFIKKMILKNDRGLKRFLMKTNIKEMNISKEKFTEEQKEIIKNYYKESNKKLSELIGIDLGQFGYY